jgi:hypothetical protein
MHLRSLTMRAGDLAAIGGDRVTFEVEDAKKPYQNEDSSFFQQINEQAMSTNASWSSGRRSYRTLRRRF